MDRFAQGCLRLLTAVGGFFAVLGCFGSLVHTHSYSKDIVALLSGTAGICILAYEFSVGNLGALMAQSRLFEDDRFRGTLYILAGVLTLSPEFTHLSRVAGILLLISGVLHIVLWYLAKLPDYFQEWNTAAPPQPQQPEFDGTLTGYHEIQSNGHGSDLSRNIARVPLPVEPSPVSNRASSQEPSPDIAYNALGHTAATT